MARKLTQEMADDIAAEESKILSAAMAEAKVDHLQKRLVLLGAELRMVREEYAEFKKKHNNQSCGRQQGGSKDRSGGARSSKAR